MLKQLLLIMAFFLVLVGCTQLIEEEASSENTYTGDDGCVYCHTNASRLAVLAPPGDHGDGADGG